MHPRRQTVFVYLVMVYGVPHCVAVLSDLYLRLPHTANQVPTQPPLPVTLPTAAQQAHALPTVTIGAWQPPSATAAAVPSSKVPDKAPDSQGASMQAPLHAVEPVAAAALNAAVVAQRVQVSRSASQLEAEAAAKEVCADFGCYHACVWCVCAACRVCGCMKIQLCVIRNQLNHSRYSWRPGRL